MNEDTRSRHSGIVGIKDLELPITIIGAGSVGSFTALSLTKMGCSNVSVYDYDVVEKQNVGCQFYGEGDVGKPKVEELNNYIWHHCGVEMTTTQDKWKTNEHDESKIIICAVDTMEDRREIWEKLKEDYNVVYYIDARMGGELMRIHTVDMTDPESIKQYARTLDAKPAPIACSERSIVYNVFFIAGFITNQVKRIVRKQPLSNSITFDIASDNLLYGSYIN